MPVEPVCPVEAIFYEDDTPDEWKDYYKAKRRVLRRVGSPGGASKLGLIERDHPLHRRAGPPQNQDHQ
ncbi:hypothetical protein GCM10020221_20900 [Streptomyces thioluteus]|uniref:Ferredoxin n=1 Tax=Streptomyces thioluteus TaxID=66431 RepID=A0ABN3WQW5_STRTU